MLKQALSIWTASLLAAASSQATLIAITQADLPQGDVLLLLSGTWADELGNPGAGFPLGEWISHSSVIGDYVTVCDTFNDPLLKDRQVTVTNMNPSDIPTLFFVINGLVTPGSFSNVDGLVNGSLAMQIDAVGVNQPLVYESMAADGVFQAGETWRFIVQDYVSAPNVDFFFSQGLAGSGDPLPSILVPEPSGILLGLLGGLMVWRRRR